MGKYRLYLHHRCEKVLLNGKSEQKKCWSSNKNREIRVHAEKGKEPVSDIHGNHHEIAMGKVNNPHNAHDKSHTQGNQRVKTT
jgi:hypothetical protein